MAVLSMKRLDALLDLVRFEVPRAVGSAGNFDDWRVVAPAFVAIAANLLEGIVGAPPPRGRLQAEVLARSLSEYAIRFAWIAASANDAVLQERLNRLVKDEFIERERGARQVERMAAEERYAHLFGPGRPGPLPRELLADSTRQRLDELKADASIKKLPSAVDMAYEADRRWMPEIPLVRHNPFALIYFVVFKGPSFMTHPSVTAVSAVTSGTPPNLLVGRVVSQAAEQPYGQGFMTMVNMLLVASRAVSWPDENAVQRVLELTD